MHPYDNRRYYMQALGHGQNLPPGQRSNLNPHLHPLNRYPFYGPLNSVNPGGSSSPSGTADRVGTNSQPPAEEGVLSGSTYRTRPWLSSPWQNMPFTRDDDVMLARRIQPRPGPSTQSTHPPPSTLLWPGLASEAPYAGEDEKMMRRQRAQEAVLGGKTYPDSPWNASSSSANPYLGDDETFARQLQAQEGDLYESTRQHLPSVGSSSQTVPYIGNDELIARQLQAQFEAEDVESNAAASPPSWAHKDEPLPGSSFSLPISIDEDEPSVHQFGAEPDAKVPQAMEADETRAQHIAGLGFTAQKPHVPTEGAATVSFAQQVTRTDCAACGKQCLPGQMDVVRLFKGWLNTQAQLKSGVECPHCKAVTCVGCGARKSMEDVMNHTTVNGIKLDWCCDRGRLFLIWVLLCGFDNQHSCDTRRNNYFRQTNIRTSTSNHRGIGYGGDPPSFHEYAAHFPGYDPAKDNRFIPPPNPLQSNSKAAVRDRVDALTAQVLALVTALLPTFEGMSDFDLNPPPEILSMLLNSLILDKTAELLRNDSLEDATRRYALYICALEFVRALGSHCTTAQAAVHDERNLKPEGTDLLKLSFSTSPSSKGKGKDEKTQSIASCLGNLNTQSNMMLRNAKANEKDFNAADSQLMLRLCRRISELVDFLQANSSPVVKGGTKATGWEQWQKENCLLDIPDTRILVGHYYAQEAAQMQSPPTGRMKHLMLDVTRLKTGLPAGIFVRYGSSRLDVMKVMIVGPVGTPYEGGLFEFDLLCPFDYPNKPPKMWFRTTGGGDAHFNPNLYRDGKVCLSLLGTWQGETWRPGKSTLLQVFLSIQAMIFCDDPWCNEPGREGQSGSSMSQNYNKTIQALTARYAILHWLQAIDIGIWNDVVSEHFKNNADTILQTVNKWAKDSQTKPMTRLSIRSTTAQELPELALELHERLGTYKGRQVVKR
ncbi:MAG: glycylpeptide N-tetradecanoyltransferase [Peltula sp. TS41687]|nr:MAG: glycylpeptide N-tetradecanoyltransferase [Peltula sp. TS41687]